MTTTATVITAAEVTRAIKAECAALEAFDFDDLRLIPDDNRSFNPSGKYTNEQCVVIGVACAKIVQQISGASWELKNAREAVRCKRLAQAVARVASATRCRLRAQQIAKDIREELSQ